MLYKNIFIHFSIDLNAHLHACNLKKNSILYLYSIHILMHKIFKITNKCFYLIMDKILCCLDGGCEFLLSLL